MEILLTSTQIIKRRPVWRYGILIKLVPPQKTGHSSYSPKGKPYALYNLKDVIRAEQTDEFKQWRARYAAKKRSKL
jgi:hypothetical protein